MAPPPVGTSGADVPHGELHARQATPLFSLVETQATNVPKGTRSDHSGQHTIRSRRSLSRPRLRHLDAPGTVGSSVPVLLSDFSRHAIETHRGLTWHHANGRGGV